MAEQSNIAWCDGTFNPWIGCTKISPACDNCYAESWAARFEMAEWGANKPRYRTTVKNWNKVRSWNRKAQAAGNRPRIFCSSLADVFDNQVPVEWRADLLALIAETQQLDWLLLTKRIGNAMDLLREVAEMPASDAYPGQHAGSHAGRALAQAWVSGNPPQHVWLGATICNQDEANRDIPKLLKTPAVVHFLSMEPLLGPVDLTSLDLGTAYGCLDVLHGRRGDYMGSDKPYMTGSVDWVIVGGESGAKARPMHPQWVLDLRDQCQTAGKPFLFKQWGEWVPRSACYHTLEDGTSLVDSDKDSHLWPCVRVTHAGKNGHDLVQSSKGDDAYMQRIGVTLSGRMLQGVTHDGFPASPAGVFLED